MFQLLVIYYLSQDHKDLQITVFIQYYNNYVFQQYNVKINTAKRLAYFVSFILIVPSGDSSAVM